MFCYSQCCLMLEVTELASFPNLSVASWHLFLCLHKPPLTFLPLSITDVQGGVITQCREDRDIMNLFT